MRLSLLALISLGALALAQDPADERFTKALLDRAEEEYRLYFKRPEKVTIIETMPKNAVGKIDKQTVRSWYWKDGRAV